MPKVLVAGEKTFFIHSFSKDELDRLEISRTRNDSTYAIGAALDEANASSETLDAIKPDIMMLLKQSDTWKKAQHNPEMDGFSLLVFRGKNQNARKNYIATWCGQSPSEMLLHSPETLIQQFVATPQLFNPKDFHSKSIYHTLKPKI